MVGDGAGGRRVHSLWSTEIVTATRLTSTPIRLADELAAATRQFKMGRQARRRSLRPVPDHRSVMVSVRSGSRFGAGRGYRPYAVVVLNLRGMMDPSERVRDLQPRQSTCAMCTSWLSHVHQDGGLPLLRWRGDSQRSSDRWLAGPLPRE